MTKRDLEIFVAVAETGSITEAAKNLYITQASVSQAVSNLERKYDMLLFDRLSRRLYLSAAGKQFYTYARRILDLNLEMEDFLQGTAAHSRLRIGATITVGTCIISPLLTYLKKENPGFNAEVLIANTHIIEAKLLKNELDVGLVEGRTESLDLKQEDAIEDQMVLACANEHRFYGRPSVSLRDLAHEPLILRERGSGTRAQLEKQLQALGLTLNAIWTSYSPEAIIQGVLAGHGISVISRRLVEVRAREHKLWLCDIEGLDLKRSFALVQHKDKLVNLPLRQFREACFTHPFI